jgi:glycosyltransferase involved in cell wall biosynthesis
MNRLSVFITTLNNAATLERCLASVAWAEDLVVLDSGSSDATREIAERYGARVSIEPFKGYGAQKRAALALTRHDWVLLLDADEALTSGAVDAIQQVLAAPAAAGYTLVRIEQMFWTFAGPRTRHNRYLRLFDKRRGSIDDAPIHAAPKVDGLVYALDAAFVHFGEPSISTKVSKLNAYSDGVSAVRRARPWRMALRPLMSFLRAWLFKRHLFNGWAGFIHSVEMAHYDFLKEAKAFERTQTPTAAPTTHVAPPR